MTPSNIPSCTAIIYRSTVEMFLARLITGIPKDWTKDFENTVKPYGRPVGTSEDLGDNHTWISANQ